MKSLDKAWLGILLSACVAGMLWCGGCSMTPMQKARTTIAISADAVVAVDRAVTPGFREASEERLENPERFQRFNVVVTTLLLARMAILDAEVALDAIEAGQEVDIGAVIACIVEAVQNLIDVLPTLDVEMPEALLTVMSMASAFVGTCGPAHNVDTSAIPNVSEAISVAP